MNPRKKKEKRSMQVVNPQAAGIDLGSEVHYVCVPEGACEDPIRRFECFTLDLYTLAAWLKECEVTTVAMESTGVYWIPLYQILEKQGFEVLLVNARHVKNVPGRKSDVQDCQWLQRLHSYGLLRGSFRPENEMCVLRNYIRQRESLIRSAATHVLRMQKALTQMNIQLHKVISDITGVTGTRIIESILEGKRDPNYLAQLKDRRIKSDVKKIVDALEGDYREEHLFVLGQEYELYKIYQSQLNICDKKIKNYYETLETKLTEARDFSKDKFLAQKNVPAFNLKAELYRISGVDFTQIPGLNILTVQTILSEVGLNPNKWPTEKHFASWLGLSPANKLTGEKVFNTRTRKVINRASIAFRIGANAVGKSKTALGAHYRRLRSRLGAPKAITATARKLACLFYQMMKYKNEYVEKGIEYYEKRFQERVLKTVQRKAMELGCVLVPKESLESLVS